MSDLAKVVSAVVGLVASCFFLYTNFMVYQSASTVMGVINPSDPLRGTLNVVDNRHEKSGRLKYGYLAMANFDAIEAERSVNFSTYVSLRSMLRSGETLPDRDYREVFAQARAVEYAHQECDLIKQYFARECVVKHVRASTDKTGKSIRIIARLSFIQAGDFGDISDTSATWSFRDITSRIKVAEAAKARTLRSRAKVYRKVMRECASIRRREGNCAITGLSISARRSRKSGLIRMSASAKYAFLKRLQGV